MELLMPNPLNNIAGLGSQMGRNIQTSGSIKQSGLGPKPKKPKKPKSPYAPLGLPPGFSHGINR